ncbi:MAG: HlyD family efflux transporter periplasmic adaptor subunit [Acidobacteriota bacterium]|nr:HlyD family efflux transporter periplasmic adaptor subunit [Acidobacteriota bacterium]MDH3784499.1 HlyD family efflux transporter periplasmic adaptor subunit [Acidobacteriota bacterium]
MDREIDISIRRGRVRRRVVVGLLVAGSLVATVLLAAEWLRPSVHRSRVRFATVERGGFEATVQASGTVVPASERVLSSPAEVRVERVLRRPGERVEAGEPILELDTGDIELRLDAIDDRLQKNSSERTQKTVQHEDRVAALRSQIQIQELDLEIVRYKLDQSRRLFAEGLVSEEGFKQAEVEVRRAEIQLIRSQEEVVSVERGYVAELQRMQLDADLLVKDRREIERQLELATTRSPVDGVLTWVADEVGSTIATGSVLARIADLRSFRVEATVSDAYAPRLKIGQLVRIGFAGQTLDATLSSILPTIESGVLSFEVALENADHSALRHNLRVDAIVVTDSSSDTLVAPRGPYIQRGGLEHKVFVVRGDRAYRTEVRFGRSGHDFYEVLSGLEEGDSIIVSDMRSSLHARELRVK